MCSPSWMLARAAGLIVSPDGSRVAVNSSWFACPNASSSSLVTEPWSVVVSDPPPADLPYLQRRGQFISSPNHWAVLFARSLFGGGVCAVVAPSSSGVVPCDESECCECSLCLSRSSREAKQHEQSSFSSTVISLPSSAVETTCLLPSNDSALVPSASEEEGRCTVVVLHASLPPPVVLRVCVGVVIDGMGAGRTADVTSDSRLSQSRLIRLERDFTKSFTSFGVSFGGVRWGGHIISRDFESRVSRVFCGIAIATDVQRRAWIKVSAELDGGNHIRSVFIHGGGGDTMIFDGGGGVSQSQPSPSIAMCRVACESCVTSCVRFVHESVSGAFVQLNACGGVCVVVRDHCCAVVRFTVSLAVPIPPVVLVGGASIVWSGVLGFASNHSSSRRLIHLSSQSFTAPPTVRSIDRVLCDRVAVCALHACRRECACGIVIVIVVWNACALNVIGVCVECVCLVGVFCCRCDGCVCCWLDVLCGCDVIGLIAVNLFGSERSVTLCDSATHLPSSTSSLLLQPASSIIPAHRSFLHDLCCRSTELSSVRPPLLR